MASTFYITAGLPAQDNDLDRGTNAFYITAGLVANDYAAGEEEVAVSGGINKWSADLARKTHQFRSQSGDF